MKPDKQLLKAWENGVQLRDAWWQLASATVQEEFYNLKSEELHLEQERLLKAGLIDGIYSGEFRAIGFDSANRNIPAYIPKHYFFRTVKIDWDRDFVGS